VRVVAFEAGFAPPRLPPRAGVVDAEYRYHFAVLASAHPPRQKVIILERIVRNFKPACWVISQYRLPVWAGCRERGVWWAGVRLAELVLSNALLRYM
jgi:hypothetical protein